MADISAQAVASLRSRTGVSILQVKKALEDAEGNEEKAIEILRKGGLSMAAKKADRDQTEGLVFGAEEAGKAGIVTIKCETDFVARDENFLALGKGLAETLVRDGVDKVKSEAEQKVPDAVQKLGENISLGDVELVDAPVLGMYIHSNAKIGVVVGLSGGSTEIAKDVAMHAAAMGPEYISPDDVPSELIEKEKEIWAEQLAAEKKPAEIIEKIMGGKEKKFRQEQALISQDFVKDPGKTVEAHLDGNTVVAYSRMAI